MIVVESVVREQSTLFSQGAIIPKKSCVKECRQNLKPLKREPSVCDSCGVVSGGRKRPVDFDGVSFNLCEKCYGRAKRYVERGC